MRSMKHSIAVILAGIFLTVSTAGMIDLIRSNTILNGKWYTVEELFNAAQRVAERTEEISGKAVLECLLYENENRLFILYEQSFHSRVTDQEALRTRIGSVQGELAGSHYKEAYSVAEEWKNGTKAKSRVIINGMDTLAAESDLGTGKRFPELTILSKAADRFIIGNRKCTYHGISCIQLEGSLPCTSVKSICKVLDPAGFHMEVLIPEKESSGEGVVPISLWIDMADGGVVGIQIDMSEWIELSESQEERLILTIQYAGSRKTDP